MLNDILKSTIESQGSLAVLAASGRKSHNPIVQGSAISARAVARDLLYLCDVSYNILDFPFAKHRTKALSQPMSLTKIIRWFGVYGTLFLGGSFFSTTADAEQLDSFGQSVAVQDSPEEETESSDDTEEEDTPEAEEGEQLLTDAELVDLKKLYDQLGNANFQVREAATSQLTKFGPGAVKPLKKLQSEEKSAEVVARCQLAIDHIERSGLSARIELFMRSPANIEEHQFYGWPAFSKVVGAGRMARQLFISMLARHDRLCNESVSNEGFVEYEQEFIKLLQDDIKHYHLTTVADAVVAQYLMIQLKDKSTADLEMISNRLATTAPYSTELNDSPTKTLKRLTGLWMTNIQRDPAYALMAALNFQVPEGAILARKTLTSGDTGGLNYGLCMQTLMVYGTMDDLPLVERFFKDIRDVSRHTILLGDGSSGTIVQEYRDLALGVAVQIRGYTMTDYFPAVTPHHLRRFMPDSIMFAGADPMALREAAFERYEKAVAGQQSSAN